MEIPYGSSLFTIVKPMSRNGKRTKIGDCLANSNFSVPLKVTRAYGPPRSNYFEAVYMRTSARSKPHFEGVMGDRNFDAETRYLIRRR